MNKFKLFSAFNHLDPEIIEESEQYRGSKHQNKNHKIRKVIFTAAAAAAAVFIMVPNISPVAAHAMAEIPIIGTVVKAITFRDYSDEQENTRIEIEVPHVEIEEETSTVPSEGVASVNVDIDRIASELIEKYQAALKEDDPHLDIYMDYETVASTESYFTLKLNCFEASGGGYNWNKFYTIDCNTGKQLQLKDLFTEDADYVTAISNDILEQMKEQMAADENLIYFIDEDEPGDHFTQIKEDQNFYVNSDKQLVIAFDEYEVAPGYMGTVEFTVSSDAIESILKK